MKQALIFALLALSFNAFTQNNQPPLSPKENFLRCVELKEKKPSYIGCNFFLGQEFIHQPHYKGSLLQIFDSDYLWHLDTVSSGWKNHTKDINMVYDAHHNMTSALNQAWNDSAWENISQTLFTYDASDNRTSFIEKDWNGSDWVNTYHFIYDYDAIKNKTSELEQIWDIWNGTGWMNGCQYIYTYNSNNKRTIELNQKWDWNLGVWHNSEKDTLTYDNNNNLISDLLQVSGVGSIWLNTWQIINTYDVSNNMTNELIQKWVNNAWVNSEQYIATYDVNNNMTNELIQDWTYNAWVNREKDTLIYDTNHNLASIFQQGWNGSAWLNTLQLNITYDANNFQKSISIKYWNYNGTKVTSGDSTYYYFHTVLGINELKPQGRNITVYPNPATDKITIESSANQTKSQLTILNLNGQQVFTCQISEPKTQIDITNLPSGVYFVRLTNDKTVEVGKFIKQ
jgi:hypothetical protein